MAKGNKGFASMDEQKRKDVASKGGQSQGADNNPANFANDTQKTSDTGQKGGKNNRSSSNS